MGSLWQTHPTQDQTAPQVGAGNDHRIGAPASRVPAASREDFHSKAIPVAYITEPAMDTWFLVEQI